MATNGKMVFGIRTLTGLWFDGFEFSSYDASTAFTSPTYETAQLRIQMAWSIGPPSFLEIVQIQTEL